MQTLYPESGLRSAPSWPKIKKMTMRSQLSKMPSSSNCFDLVLFLLSILNTSLSFMSISPLVPEFSFIRDWLEIWKLEIPSSEFCGISADWGKLWIQNLARMFLKAFYWMLVNSRVTAFTIFELLYLYCKLTFSG